MCMGGDMVRVAVACKRYSGPIERCDVPLKLSWHRSVLRSWNNVPNSLSTPLDFPQARADLAGAHTLLSFLVPSILFPSFLPALLSLLSFALIVSQHVEGTSASANFETPSLRSSIWDQALSNLDRTRTRRS